MAKTVLALIFILIVSASIPSSVFAAAKPGSKPIPVALGGFSVSPTIGGYFFSGSEQRDPTQSYGLKVGYEKIGKSMADNVGIEATLNYLTTKSKTEASDNPAYLFRLDAIYPFTLGAKWMPFLAAGAGGIIIDHGDKSPLFNYGVGVKYFLENYLALRMDARQLFIYDKVNTRNNFEASIGVSYYFGKERKKKPVPPPAIKQEQKKPDVAEIKSASAMPALEEIEKTAERRFDAEKPAVKCDTPSVPPLIPFMALTPLMALESAFIPLYQTETRQECPGEGSLEGSPAKVEAVSMPDCPDKGTTTAGKCEATSQRAPAKAGKPARQTVERHVVRKLTIEFDSNSTYIKPEYYKKLVELANFMKSSADASAMIDGHTDSTGEESTNTKLSEQRAQGVKNRLINLGVKPGRISTVGFGPTIPLGDNATIEGRQKNRRAVTIVIQ